MSGVNQRTSPSELTLTDPKGQPGIRRAIMRKPGGNAHLGLTTASLGQPDFERMLAQHDTYVRTLESCGIAVEMLEGDERYPDGCFVEDVAVVTPDCIVLTRPGAPSRRGESELIEPVLANYGRLERIEAPGCVDGGDVIVAGNRVLVGLSNRTNREGADQLENILAGNGMSVRTVPVAGGLHLKSDVNHLDGDRLLVTRAFACRNELADFDKLVVPAGENYAANSLRLGNLVLIPEGFPATRELLERAGYTVVALDMSEFRKMDGGLTCLSIRFDAGGN